MTPIFTSFLPSLPRIIYDPICYESILSSGQKFIQIPFDTSYAHQVSQKDYDFVIVLPSPLPIFDFSFQLHVMSELLYPKILYYHIPYPLQEPLESLLTSLAVAFVSGIYFSAPFFYLSELLDRSISHNEQKNLGLSFGVSLIQPSLHDIQTFKAKGASWVFDHSQLKPLSL